MSRASTALSMLVLALMTAPASARPVVDLALGEKVAGKPGSSIDLYRFGGESGTTIKATLTAPGTSALILYSADGVEMLSARGTGKVTLDAILPLWSSYLIGVVRKNDARPYVLGIEGQKPDDQLAIFAHRVGYVFQRSDKGKPYEVSSCWIEPGVKVRIEWPTGVEELTIGRGGKEFGVWKANNDRTGAAEREVRIEGANIVYHRTDGSRPDITAPFEEVLSTANLKRYNRYLCDPAS